MTPQLRFPEFTDEWQVKKLGDLLSVGSGRDYKHLKDGSVPVYGTGGLMTYVDDYLHDGASVAIGRKGTIDQPQFLTGKFWTVDTLFYTHSYKDSTPEFVYLLFQRINWQKWNEASGVPSLSSSTIKAIKTAVPSLEEQQKIADFLTAVDDKISALEQKTEKLETYKRGVMQKIFARRVRFTRPDGSPYPEWETKKLGDIATIKTGDLNVEDAKDDGRYTFFDRSEDIKKFNQYSYDNEALIYAGEGAKFLPRYFHGKYGLHQRAYTIFDADGVDMLYLYYYMLTQNKHFLRTAVGTTVKSLRMDCFTKCNILVPSPEEQQKIADFLSAIDQKITLTTQQLEKAKEFKKGLLQRMFV